MPKKGDSSRDAQLLRAVLANDFPTVRKLVKSGASANGNRQAMQDTPLLVASDRGYVVIAEFLIGAGADVETGYLEDRYLYERGEKVATKGMRPLHVAGNAETTALLLREGADPNSRDAKGRTPLIIAAGSRKSTAVVYVRNLLNSGADPRLNAKDGAIALFSAINTGDIAPINELLARAPDTINHTAVRDCMTPLCLAAMSGRVDVIELLLSRGATNKAALQKIGIGNAACPLFVAVIGRKEEAVRCIVEKGIEAIGGFDLVPSALFAAASQSGPPNMLRMILTAGGAGQIRRWARCTYLGRRLLNYAAGHNSLAAVDVLLQAGAIETEVDAHGRDAIDAVGSHIGASNSVEHIPARQGPPKVRDPAKEALIRRVLRRGPAYRARSWAWPLARLVKNGAPARVGGAGTGANGVSARAKMVPPISGKPIVPLSVALRIHRSTGPSFFSRVALERYSRKR